MKAFRTAFAAAALAAALLLCACPDESVDEPLIGSWSSETTGLRSYDFAKDGSSTFTIDVSPGSTVLLPPEILTVYSWQASTSYEAGDYMITQTGVRYFLCVEGGTSGTTEPGTPATVGSTAIDGSVTWEYVDELVARGTWTLSDSTLTIVWTGASTQVYTISFFSSGDRLRLDAGTAYFELERI